MGVGPARIGGWVLMPALLGMPLFPMDQMSMWSLFGHVLFGLLAGATLYGLSRNEPWDPLRNGHASAACPARCRPCPSRA
ncbi:hypothetical protein DFP74_4845 [Nocardiopsis sp. Huas11]|nr:hypothetical protein DFP74_4845 [Nocardiopsis sp. Huas11]